MSAFFNFDRLVDDEAVVRALGIPSREIEHEPGKWLVEIRPDLEPERRA